MLSQTDERMEAIDDGVVEFVGGPMCGQEMDVGRIVRDSGGSKIPDRFEVELNARHRCLAGLPTEGRKRKYIGVYWRTDDRTFTWDGEIVR